MARRVPTVPGLRDLQQVLDLINDKDRYAKALDELGKAHEEAVAATALLGKADEIDDLHAQAKHEAEVYREKMTGANKEAEDILAAARKTVADERAAFVAECNEVKTKQRDKKAALDTRENALNARHEEITGREKNIDAREAKAAETAKAGADAKARYDALIAQIKAVQQEALGG
jgi:hypothetical protein